MAQSHGTMDKFQNTITLHTASESQSSDEQNNALSLTDHQRGGDIQTSEITNGTKTVLISKNIYISDSSNNAQNEKQIDHI